jgi:uncharacterized membrane protein
VFHLDVTYVAMTIHACFICFQMYVSSVSSRRFKSRSGETHVTMEPVAGRQQLAATVGGAAVGHVRVPKADRCLCSVHTQAGQVIRTDPIRMQVREM